MTLGIRAADRLAPALHVELTSPGTVDGARTYHVDHVGRDGRRCLVWAGESYIEAAIAAIDCGGDGVPVWDLTAQAPEPPRIDATAGPGVQISIRTAPTMVQIG